MNIPHKYVAEDHTSILCCELALRGVDLDPAQC